MVCEHGLKLRYGGVREGHSVYFHKLDGRECEPDQDKTFEHVEAMLPILRKKLLREAVCPKRTQ